MIVVCDNRKLTEEIQSSLITPHDLLSRVRRLVSTEPKFSLKLRRTVMHRDEYTALLALGTFRDELTLVVMDTYFGIPPTAHAETDILSPEHPAIDMIQRTSDMRPKWIILAMTHEGCVNDGSLAKSRGAYEFLSTGVLGWQKLVHNAVENAVERQAVLAPAVA